jgi:C1A family cysteine protease/fibronectin type 3 domain-containing protein
MAAVLACAMLLSDIPVTQLMAAPADTTVQTVETPGEENENGTGDGSGDKSENGGENGSGDESGTGNENGSGGENGTGDGSGDKSETGGENGTGDESGSSHENGTGNENGSGDQDSDTGENGSDDSEEAAEEDADETDDEETLAVDAEIDLEDEEETDGLTEEEIAAQKALEPEYLPELEPFELMEDYVPEDGYGIMDEDELPSQYDSRDEGILPAVRYQGSRWGTCWAFASLASFEISLVRAKLADVSSIDLSERHLAYFVYHTGYDRLGNANGDTITSPDSTYYLENGGNTFQAAIRLMNWQGAAEESLYPYYTNTIPADLDREDAQDDSYHLRSCYFLSTKANDADSIKNVKSMVKQYGAVTWSYYHNDNYYNYGSYAYCNNATVSMPNHEIVIVGWNDNFPKERFKSGCQPSNDGAWIVRNSWSSSWGNKGYFYISYEDISLGYGNSAAVFEADVADDYDNNYFYGNTTTNTGQGYYGKVAQVYQVKGLSTNKEQLKAVSFMMSNTNIEYRIQIYKNPELVNGVVKDPESGTPMLDKEVTGKTSYAGVYTVDLDTPVTFEADDYMAAVIYFDNKTAYLYADRSSMKSSSKGTLNYYNETDSGQSFGSSDSTSGNWKDLSSTARCSLRINLLTSNVEDTALTPVVKATVKQPGSFKGTYKVSLRWYECPDVLSYEILRAKSADGEYEIVGTTDASIRTYQDEISRDDYAENYYYKVRAIYSDDISEESEPVILSLKDEVEILDFAASFDEKIATLSWSAAEGATGYEIQRKEKNDAEYELLATIESGGTNSYTDDLSTMGVGTYLYRVRAYSTNKEYSAWSEAQSVIVGLKLSQVDYKTVKVEMPKLDNAFYKWLYVSADKDGSSWKKTSTFQTTFTIDMTNQFSDFQVGDTYYYYGQITDNYQYEIHKTGIIPFQTTPDALTCETMELTETGVQLSWSGGGGADSVQIYRSESRTRGTDVYATVSVEDGSSSYTDTNVTKGKTYYYWICPTVQNSEEETVQGDMTECGSMKFTSIAPTVSLKSAAADSDTAVSLDWDQTTGAAGYYLYRSTTAGSAGTQIKEITSGSATSWTDTGLTPGDTYYYSIAAYVKDGNETVTGKVSAQKAVRTKPSKTVIDTTTDVSDSGITVSWTQAAGADGYLIERKTGSGTFEQVKDIAGGSTVSYQDTAVTSGNVYIYQVTAYNKDVNNEQQKGETSAATTAAAFQTRPQAVTISSVELIGDSSVKLTWSGGSGADSFEIYRSESANANGSKIATESQGTTSYTDSTVVKGRTYYYRIRPVVQDVLGNTVSGEMSAYHVITVPYLTEETVLASIVVDSDTAVTLTWAKNTQADGYYLYRSTTAGSTGTQIKEITSNSTTSWTNTGLTPGGVYYYSIAAYVKDGDETVIGNVSAQKAVRTKPSKTVINATTDVSDSSITVSWTQAKGADGYIVERQTGSGSFTQVKDITDGSTVSYEDTTVTSGYAYTYRVTAYNADVNSNQQKGETSAATTTVAFQTKPQTVTISSIELIGDSSVKLTWSGGSGADSFEIHRSESADENGSTIATESQGTISYTDSTVVKGKAYYYRIRPVVQDALGNTVLGEMSDYQVIAVPYLTEETVLASAVADSDTAVTLTWAKNKQADGYYLYRSTTADSTGGQCADIDNSETLTWQDENLEAGVTYYYSIAPYALEDSDKRIGNISAQKSVITKPAKPVMEEPAANDDGSITVGWQQAKGAEGYLVERRTEEDDYTRLAELAGTSYTDKSAVAGSTYLYRVTAYNSAADGSQQYGQASDEKKITAAKKSSGTVDAKLVLSPGNVVVSKGNSVKINVSVTPENVHYEGLTWKVKNKSYTMDSSQENTFIVKGTDGEEILRIVDNVLYATGNSTDKEVQLTAVKTGDLEADMEVLVNVPVTGLTMQAMNPDSGQTTGLSDMTIGQSVDVGVTYTPVNADDATVTWKSSNEKVATVAKKNESTVTVTAEGVGECTLTASTADGVSVVQKITVNKGENIYGILVSEVSLEGQSVSAGESGSWIVEGIAEGEEYPQTYELDLDDEENVSVTVGAYLLKDSGKRMDGETVVGGILQKAAAGEVIWRSADSSVATIDTEGKITGAGAGETDIFACDTKGNGVYGSCHIKVTGDTVPKETDKDYSLDKSWKLSAVQASAQIQSYQNDSESSVTLQVKNQYGALISADYFDYVSDKPEVCIVDENGKVTPNPGYTVTKDAKVKITASLKNDTTSKRKVTFTVTVLAADQIDRIEIQQKTDTGTSAIEGVLGKEFVKNATLIFQAKALDRKQNVITNPSVKFTVSDTSVAAVKYNKNDQTVTLTMKKPGRFNLICTATDALQATASVQIALVSTTPIVSASQVNLNKMSAPVEKNTSTEGNAAEMPNDQTAEYVSDSFTVYAPNGAAIDSIGIKDVTAGKTTVDADFFRVVNNGGSSYSIAINNAAFLNEIKNNTTYIVTMSAAVSAAPELGLAADTTDITMKVKIISKEPTVKVTAAAVNLSMNQDSDRMSLLTIKASDTVTKVEIPAGQDSGFENYFTVEHINGRWYLQFKDNTESYDQKSIKGTLSITVDGYLPINKIVTVKTATTAQNIKQQSVPSIYVDETGTGSAVISLYNATQKETVTGQLDVTELDSQKLNVWGQNDGTLRAEILDGSVINNGEKLTATVKIMEKENGKACWTEPVSVKISVKAYTKDPTLSMKSKTLTLNKQLPKETAETTLTLNCQNVSFQDAGQWQISLYNSGVKDYVPQTKDAGWLAVSYDEDSQSLKVGFAVKQSTGETSDETAAEGADLSAVEAGKSYKFRISNLVNGFDTLYQDFTVKVVDAEPKVTVKVNGKLDLVNRDNAALTGKITLKNVPSGVKNVTILKDVETAENVDSRTETNPYFEASEVTNAAFQITMTDQGKTAALTTTKLTLPILVELEDGTKLTLTSGLSFKPMQSTPKVTVPAAQTIYKSVSNLTRDYNLGNGLTQGVEISKIEVASAPAGFGTIVKNGHVLVTLNDRGIKAGTYKVKVNIYFKGEAAVSGYPDGKPVSKVISVKVTE